MRREELGSFRLAFGAWLFGVFAFFLPAATWNPVSRFDLTRAIVEEHRLTIDSFVTNTGDRAFAHGHWYTDKPPIVSLVAVPVYAVVNALQRARGLEPRIETLGTVSHPAVHVVPNRAFQQALYACSLATSAASGVAVAILLFELLRRRTTNRVAFLSTTFIVLGTPLFPYSTSFYSHVPAAALLLGACVAIDQRGERPVTSLPSAARIRRAGACLALAPGCEYLTMVPAAIVGTLFVLRTRREDRYRAIRELAVGAFVPVLVVCAYHTAAFGAPWRTGYSFMTNPEFAAGHASGLLGIRLPSWPGIYGLLLGTRRGLFYLTPLAVFGLMFGVQHARRRADFAVGAGLAVLLSLFWLNASYYMWWGGAAAGPRHLIPGLPFLAAGVMVALRGRWPWLRTLTVMLGFVSMANFFAITSAGIEAPERGDILFKYAWHRIQWGDVASVAGASNLGLKLGLTGGASLVPLLLWEVAGFGYLSLRLQRRRRWLRQLA